MSEGRILSPQFVMQEPKRMGTPNRRLLCKVPFSLLLAIISLAFPYLHTELPPADVASRLSQLGNASQSRLLVIATDIYFYNQERYLPPPEVVVYIEPTVWVSLSDIRVTYEHGIYNVARDEKVETGEKTSQVYVKPLKFWGSLLAVRLNAETNRLLASLMDDDVNFLYDVLAVPTPEIVRIVIFQRLLRLLMLLLCIVTAVFRLIGINIYTIGIFLAILVLQIGTSVAQMSVLTFLYARVGFQYFTGFMLFLLCQSSILLADCVFAIWAVAAKKTTCESHQLGQQSKADESSSLYLAGPPILDVVPPLSPLEKALYFGKIKKPSWMGNEAKITLEEHVPEKEVVATDEVDSDKKPNELETSLVFQEGPLRNTNSLSPFNPFGTFTGVGAWLIGANPPAEDVSFATTLT